MQFKFHRNKFLFFSKIFFVDELRLIKSTQLITELLDAPILQNCLVFELGTSKLELTLDFVASARYLLLAR